MTREILKCKSMMVIMIIPSSEKIRTNQQIVKSADRSKKKLVYLSCALC